MNNQTVLNKIRKELKQHVDFKYRKGSINFFKEKIKVHGVRSGIVRKIGKKYWKDVKDKFVEEIFTLCEQLLKSDYNEESTIAFSWAMNCRPRFEKKHFFVFESWVKKYVNNWAKCDDFCTHAFNRLLLKYPEFYSNVKKWTKSKNRWMRRAAAVIHISTEKQFYSSKNLKHIFEIADILLMDSDDLVQKGYGWMLKVASNHYQKQVFDYVMKNKKTMPRTALRYAIEKMPKGLKKKAMAK
tara:strand:+ start:213 stop:935 length:723 start_codon:yes stop_codon:yes gene_type:complete